MLADVAKEAVMPILMASIGSLAEDQVFSGCHPKPVQRLMYHCACIMQSAWAAAGESTHAVIRWVADPGQSRI